jgi:hypothetical protein
VSACGGRPKERFSLAWSDSLNDGIVKEIPTGFGVHVKFIIPIRNQNGPQTNTSS